MKFNDIIGRLPSGFHDAELISFEVNCLRREARIALNIWIGDLNSEIEAERECMRPALLTLSGVRYCVMEPPDPRYFDLDQGSITIDMGPADSSSGRPVIALPGPTSSSGFSIWIFLQQRNAFIDLWALDASLEWKA